MQYGRSYSLGVVSLNKITLVMIAMFLPLVLIPGQVDAFTENNQYVYISESSFVVFETTSTGFELIGGGIKVESGDEMIDGNIIINETWMMINPGDGTFGFSENHDNILFAGNLGNVENQYFLHITVDGKKGNSSMWVLNDNQEIDYYQNEGIFHRLLI